MLLEFVPIGWLHRASAACPRSFADVAWPLSALLMAGRIFVYEDPLSPQISGISHRRGCARTGPFGRRRQTPTHYAEF